MLKDVILLSAAARGARGVVGLLLFFTQCLSLLPVVVPASRDIASLIVWLVDSPLTKPTFQYGNIIC